MAIEFQCLLGVRTQPGWTSSLWLLGSAEGCGSGPAPSPGPQWEVSSTEVICPCLGLRPGGCRELPTPWDPRQGIYSSWAFSQCLLWKMGALLAHTDSPSGVCERLPLKDQVALCLPHSRCSTNIPETCE